MLFHRVDYNAKVAIVDRDVLGYNVISKTHVFCSILTLLIPTPRTE